MTKIPFNKPCFAGKELEYVRDAVRIGQISGDGFYTQKCESLLRDSLCAPCVLLTTSCTHALEMAALLTDIGPGDEVIVPSFTFVSTANAFVLRGARPVFVDIRPDTLNMDETQLEALVGKCTKAIVPVHYAGVACEMNAILAVARERRIAVVEDNAHGLFGKYRGSSLGTLGTLGALSFHETKNFICGEGGALVVNDPRLSERAEILRAKGTNRKQFLQGRVDKYSWVDVGSSYVLSEILAAFLLAQLEARDEILLQRRRVFDHYVMRLREWAEAQGARLPTHPPHCKQPYHMFYLIMPSRQHRNALIEWLKDRGITSVFHYVPLHLSRMGKKWGAKHRDLPVTEDLSERVLRLPFYNELTREDQERVCDAIQAFEYRPPRAAAVRSGRRNDDCLS